MSDSGEQNEATVAVPAPFKALIAGWSLILVVLAVAGYSFRWNYYYNFGLHSLVLGASLESLALYAIEILRNRDFLLDVLWLALVYLLPLQLALLALRRARGAQHEGARRTAQTITRVFALDNRLLIETIVASLIILIAFHAGGNAGYRAYVTNAVESTSQLPRVTAIKRASAAEGALPVICDTRTFKDPAEPPEFVGEGQVLGSLAAGAACSTDTQSWRLLLRDEKFVYLFATVPDRGRRPQTLVLPDGGDLTLILQ